MTAVGEALASGALRGDRHIALRSAAGPALIATTVLASMVGFLDARAGRSRSTCSAACSR